MDRLPLPCFAISTRISLGRPRPPLRESAPVADDRFHAQDPQTARLDWRPGDCGDLGGSHDRIRRRRAVLDIALRGRRRAPAGTNADCCSRTSSPADVPGAPGRVLLWGLSILNQKPALEVGAK